MENRRYKGIIFDLDGVICHTDTYHYMAWKSLADRLGIYFDEEINNRLRGVSRMQSLEIILEKSDKVYSDKEKEEFANSKNELYRELLNGMSEKDLDEKVRETLEILKERGYKTAIASSSKNARLILSKLKLDNFFDIIIDGNDIKHSKPDKEVFEKAGQGLLLLPEECLVVEDAASGVEGALRAGMKTAGIGEANKLSNVSYRLESFEDLQKYCL
jgi:beta-phosphoglucomutase